MSDALRLGVLPERLRRWPHLPAFWPEARLLPWPAGAEALLLAEGDAVPRRAGALPLRRVTAAPFDPPAFAGHHAPPVLFEPGAAAQRPVPPGLAAWIARERLGGPPGLADPGAAALGLPARAAVVAFSPAAAERAVAEGRRVVLARDPWAGAAPPPVAGAAVLAGRWSPWTLLDAAAELRGAGWGMALLAGLAGVPTPGAPVASLAMARWADPFRRRPCTPEEAVEWLLLWRDRAAENRRVAVCLGVARWKHRHVGALLGHEAGPPAFAASVAGALRLARRRQGGIAVWSSRERPGLRGQGVAVLALEDGFLRSRGIGARFRPGASYCLDSRRAYYDPAGPSDLERILREGISDPRLLARATALRAAIVSRGIGKYHLDGEAPALRAPAGRRVLLVPGQVEDDASVRLGGGAIRSNLALLRAVRAAEPGAWIVYKPHPDLEAGYRRGRIPQAVLAEVADEVVTGAPLSGLFGQIDGLHTLTSLSGFEALLRGVPVTVWGRPFYAGWGLTEDRSPEGFPAGRRGVARGLDELVAATLLVYPRYLDPLTRLPCTAELVLERLEDPSAWPVAPWSWHRGVEGGLRRWLAGLAGRR